MCYLSFTKRLLQLGFGMIAATATLAQTPGLIYRPATTTLGRTVFDPNGDGFVSATATGFTTTDYGPQSELDMVPFPVLTPEPLGDLTTGSAGGATDIVTATGNQSCYILYREVSGVPYLVFRLRLGGASTASKGYSFLIDTDGDFPGTGVNPGFEKEVQMATGNNGTVSIITYDANGNVSNRKDYGIDGHSQRSIALSKAGSNPDYFYDFFIPYADLGVGSQTVRMVPVTITSAGIGLTGTKSDFNGVDDIAYRNNTEAIARDLVNAFPPTLLPTLTPGSSFPTQRTLAPVVNGGITTASNTIFGTCRDAGGTVVTVYRNATSIGSATVDANGNWTLSGVSGLQSGDLITADALASGKTRSSLSNSVEVTRVQSCYLLPPTITADKPSGDKYFTVQWTWPAGQDPALNPIKIRVYSVTPSGVFTLVGVAQDLVPTTGRNGTCTYYVNGAGNISGTYVATASSATCTSGYSNTYNTGDGGNKNTVTNAPVVNTAPLFSATGSTDITVTNTHPTSANLYLYVNGVQMGSILNVSGNTSRTFTYIGLIDGDVVQARADGTGSNEVLSNYSNTVVVQASNIQTTAPSITGSYLAGGNSVSGTSGEAAGTTIYLYKSDTVLLGTTTVSAFGTWTVTALTLSAGDVVTAKAKAFGKTLSSASASKTVAASAPGAPTVSGTYTYLSTQVSGSGGNGTVTVYVDGSPIGTATGATWTLAFIPSGQLYRGAVITATNTVGGIEGLASVGVTVTGVASFLVTATDGGAIPTQTAGVPFDIRIAAKDGPSGSGSLFTAFTGRVTVSSSAFAITGGGETAAFTAGVLSPHAMSLRTAGTGKTIAVVSVDDPTATGTAVVALVKPNTAHKLSLSRPADIPAGSRAPYTVTRLDAYDNPTTSGGQDVYLSSSSASSRFFSDTVGGIELESVVIPLGMSTADFWFTDTVASIRSVAASDASPADGDLGLRDAVDTIGVVAGPASRFEMEAPAYIRVTGSTELTARLTDGYGNPVSMAGLPVQWTSSPPGNGSYFTPPGTGTTDASGISTILFTPPVDAPTDVEYTFTAASGSYMGTVASVVVIGKVWTGRMNERSDVGGNWQDEALPQEGDNLYYAPDPSNPLVMHEDLTFSKVHFRGSDGDHRILVNGRKLSVRGSIELNGFSGRIKANGPEDEVVLGGNGAQTIPANVFESDEVRHLRIDNPHGVVLGGRLVLKGTLTPVSGTLKTNGHLVLRSDAQGTARVAHGVGDYISGAVVAERHIRQNGNDGGTGRAWRMLSVPVTGTGTLRDWLMNGRPGQDLTIPSNRDAETADSGTPIVGHIHATASDATNAGFDWIGVPYQFSSLRRYIGNASGGGFNSSQVPDLSTTFDASEQGYMVFVRGDRKVPFPSTSNSGATTLRTVGELKRGDQTVSVAPATVSAYTMVGNPYMSVLDLDAFYNSNSAVVKPSFMIWDANLSGTQRQGAYLTVTRSGSTWVTNIGTHENPQLLESGMAFFVQPVDGLASPANVTIRESHKSAGASAGIMPFSTQAADGHGRLFVRLERRDTGGRAGVVDGVLLDFHASHSKGFGDPLDVVKMRNAISGGALWLSDGKRAMSMEGRPWPSSDMNDTVPLHFGGIGRQSLQLTLDARNLARPGVKAWLRDRLMDRQVELDPSGSIEYPFASTGVSEQDSLRFEIVFSARPTTVSAFLRAEALRSGAGVELRWEVSDGDAVGFAIERSADGEAFHVVRRMPADPTPGVVHRWFDAQPLKSVSFYRVKSDNGVGQTKISGLLRVDMSDGGGSWRLYPNPVGGGSVSLRLQGVSAGSYRIRMTDNSGKALSEHRVDHMGGDADHPLAIRVGLNAGVYMLQITRDGHRVATLRLVLERPVP